MAKSTKPRKKYTPRPIIKSMFGRIHQSFGSTIDWFDEQLRTGQTMTDERGEPVIITCAYKVCPVWESIESFIDLHGVAVRKGYPMPDIEQLEAMHRALKNGVLLPQKTFERAHGQLINLRNKLMRMPALTVASIAKDCEIMIHIQNQQTKGHSLEVVHV